MFLNLQVWDWWQQGGLLQKVLTGMGQNLHTLRDTYEEGGLLWKVAEALRIGLHLLSEAMAVDSPGPPWV